MHTQRVERGRRARRQAWWRATATATATALAIALSSSQAHAGDPATAQALFDQGKKLMAQERWTEACGKLEESQRLDPAGGTLLHLALCREHEGRIATAWALYQDALIQAKQDGRKDRAKIAQERIDTLGPRLPRLRVRVSPANKRADGFTLTRDEVPMGPAQWGEALPIDPGTRVLAARATGKKAWSVKIEVAARAEETVVDVPELETDPKVAAAARPSPLTVGPPALVDTTDANAGDTQRTIGLVVGGVGVAGLVVGSVFGIVSMSKASDADAQCRPPDFKLCNAGGVTAGNDAISAGNVSTIAFVVGGVLVGGGLALYFTAPAKRRVAVVPAFGPREAALSLTTTF